MVSILTDIHLLEAKLSRLTLGNDSLRKIYNSFERAVLEGHGTAKERYERSFQYYIAKPERLEHIYEIVEDSLIVLEQRVTMEMDKEKESAVEEKVQKKFHKGDTIQIPTTREVTTGKRKSKKGLKPKAH